MLRELLIKMRLRLPEQDVKRMFDLMDVNHDHTLDLRELLAGFEMLFHRFVPNQISDAVGLSYAQQLYATLVVVGCLMALFSFIGFAFTAFVVRENGHLLVWHRSASARAVWVNITLKDTGPCTVPLCIHRSICFVKQFEYLTI